MLIAYVVFYFYYTFSFDLRFDWFICKDFQRFNIWMYFTFSTMCLNIINNVLFNEIYL